jgi:hypothetical protein
MTANPAVLGETHFGLTAPTTTPGFLPALVLKKQVDQGRWLNDKLSRRRPTPTPDGNDRPEGRGVDKSGAAKVGRLERRRAELTRRICTTRDDPLFRAVSTRPTSTALCRARVGRE